MIQNIAKFTGSAVAIVTPMLLTGEIDEKAFVELISWQLREGSDGIVIGGTTGESPSLTDLELSRLLTVALDVKHEYNAAIPIIAGTGSNNTETSIQKTRLAKTCGADAALIVTPYYNKPTQVGLFLHYEKIAQAVDLPIILYNVPHRTGCDLQVETVVKLSKIPNIIGIKDASGDLTRIARYKQDDPDFRVYAGNDDEIVDFMRLGGDGVISVAANVIPKKLYALTQALLKKDFISAQKIYSALQNLYKYLFIESNPIPVKWALMQMGWIQGGIRLPLTPFSTIHQPEFTRVLKELALIRIN